MEDRRVDSGSKEEVGEGGRKSGGSRGKCWELM